MILGECAYICEDGKDTVMNVVFNIHEEERTKAKECRYGNNVGKNC